MQLPQGLLFDARSIASAGNNLPCVVTGNDFVGLAFAVERLHLRDGVALARD